MDDFTSRTEGLIGKDGLEKLKNARVIVFGAGGVGSFTLEALCRAGVGSITLVDCDEISDSNRNRQLHALTSTVGQRKTEVMAARMRDINSTAEIIPVDVFVDDTTVTRFDFSKYSFCVDAVDNVNAKIRIIEGCTKAGTPVISCMGTGNKLDPLKFRITDISKTNTCPLARAVRTRLRKLGIDRCAVLYSEEQPVKTDLTVPASISYVPSCAGLMLAGYVIRKLAGYEV